MKFYTCVFLKPKLRLTFKTRNFWLKTFQNYELVLNNPHVCGCGQRSDVKSKFNYLLYRRQNETIASKILILMVHVVEWLHNIRMTMPHFLHGGVYRAISTIYIQLWETRHKPSVRSYPMFGQTRSLCVHRDRKASLMIVCLWLLII